MKAVDLFAGIGGFTEAAESLGIRVVWAANHSRYAVDFHSQNHPQTEHACQDLHQADWRKVPAMDLLLASPCCQGHSKARGKDLPQHDASRSTAWAVVSCAEYHRPKAVIVENVVEFQNWALFPAWESAMQALGYSLSVNVLDAADAGVPQNRKRLFIVAVRGRHALAIAPPRQPHIAAESIIDWTAGRWATVKRRGRARATIQRVANGRARFGDRFLMPFYGSGSGLTGRDLSRPIGTITTVARWAIVDAERMRMLTPAECRRAMGFPEGYVIPMDVPLAHRLLGNAVPPPLAAHVINEVRRAA